MVDTMRQKLAADQVVKGGAIEVIVKDGAVTLAVRSKKTRRRTKAEKIAKKVSGVKSVVNEIKTLPNSAVSTLQDLPRYRV